VTDKDISNLPGVIDGYLEQLELEELNARYFNDPVLWAKDRLGITFYWKQEEISYAVVGNANVAVKAGHGVGKSFWASIMVCWWIDTRPINKVFAATTAPSADQVSGILWREIRRVHQLSHALYKEYLKKTKLGLDTKGLPDRPLPGYITQQNQWKDDVGNLVAQGRKPPDNKADDAFQGFHDGYVLAIGDEACGLSESMIEGLDNITTNNNSRRVLIGNPTNPLSHFGKIFREDTGAWSLHTISVMDSPNFHGDRRCTCHFYEPLGLGMPQDALDKLTDEEYVENKKKEYGEDSARFVSRVLGEFAYDAGNTLFSEYDLAQARNALVFPDLENPYLVLGVDIARLGNDSTFVYSYERGTVQATDPVTNEPLGTDLLSEETLEPLRGGRLRYVDSWKGAPFVSRSEFKDGLERTIQGTTERIHEYALALGAKEVRIDASGMGSGVIDPLYVLCRGRYLIVEIYGSASSPDRRAYHNKRAYHYSELRRRCFQGLIDIDGTDEELIDELGGIQYEFSITSGGMLIESKDSMKKRGVKSPDAADAAWYASCELDDLINSPFAGMDPGTIVTQPYDQILTSGWYTHDYSW
jgi:hypothetical protein